jgi:hypothetical protein
MYPSSLKQDLASSAQIWPVAHGSGRPHTDLADGSRDEKEEHHRWLQGLEDYGRWHCPCSAGAVNGAVS